MRDFFGDLHCHCLSFDLVLVPVTTPDEQMEVTGHLVRCVDCTESFHDAAEPGRGYDGPSNGRRSKPSGFRVGRTGVR